MRPGPPASRPFRLALRLVPRRWRESVERDLREEADRAGRRGWGATAWLVAQTIGIAGRIAGRSIADWSRERPGWRRVGVHLALDVRVATRALAREPWSTATIVLTLALGMTAGTAVFAVFNHVLFRPVAGVSDPDGLATIYFQPADRHPTYRTASREALDALRAAPAFTALGAARDAELAVVPHPDADPEFVRIEFVTDGYLQALGCRPRAGRLLSTDDLESGASVAVISERWWRLAFGADPAVIGRSMFVNREPVVIVGVMADYRGWGSLRIGTVDLWMPVDAPIADRSAVQTETMMSLVGRLRPDVSAAVAEQQLRPLFAPFAADSKFGMSMGPLSDAAPVPIVYAGLYEIGQERTRDRIAEMYPFALGGAGLLLLLACGNTANLLLARTMTRARDLAVRSALGATRWRLARAQLMEACAIVALAGSLAVLLSIPLAGFAQGEQLFEGGPPLDAIGFDWRVLVFAAALVPVTVVLFGMLPAWTASRPGVPIAPGMMSRATRGSRRLRAGLVCVQLALAVTLLAGAGVLVRTLQHLRGIDLGMNPDGVISFEVTPFRLGYSGARWEALARAIHDRLSHVPGVESAAYATPSPLWRGFSPWRIKTHPSETASEHQVSSAVVSADYFRTLQISLRAGRAFTESEAETLGGRLKDGVGIVNESLAHQLFGDAPAVGQRIYLSRALRGWQPDRTLEIVGVVADTRWGANLRAAGRPALYEPGAGAGRTVFFARSRLPLTRALAAVRGAVRELDPMLPIADLGPFGGAIDRLIPEERALALLAGVIAVVAMLLGVSGVHAIVAHGVAQRTREFGIRLALGATRGEVSRGVLWGVALLASIGVVCGLVLFASASRWLESRVYGVSALDPLTLACVSVLLVAAALAGAWLPAHRATRVDPVQALRAE